MKSTGEVLIEEHDSAPAYLEAVMNTGIKFEKNEGKNTFRRYRMNKNMIR